MSKLPITSIRRSRSLREVEDAPVEVIDSPPKFGLFFSFHYSHTEVSSQGGRTRVKSRSTHFEDGKLTSESFEGELGRDAYEQVTSEAMREAQRLFANQISLMLQSLSWFLPLGGRRSRRD